MKIFKNEGELVNFNTHFDKNVTYGNLKNHEKPRLFPLFRKQNLRTP